MNQGRQYNLESCVVSLVQAMDAQQRGADRVELCVRLETEGMTPDIELVASLCDHLTIPIRVMIRATTDGYEADRQALLEMMREIDSLKHLPLDGFVFGVIKNNRVDREAMITLLQQAYPYHVTFHKAIDTSTHIADDIEWLNQFAQVDTILTSGNAIKAIDGVRQIRDMKSLFKGHTMAAGKITAEVLPSIHEQLQLQWYHGRSIL